MRDIRHFQSLLQDKPDLLAQRLEELRSAIRQINPHQLAQHTGAIFRGLPSSPEGFEFALWGQPAWLSWPELVARQETDQKPHHSGHQALVLYYFASAGSLMAGKDATSSGDAAIERWIALSELPDGRFYTQAYQGYTGGALARRFNSQPLHFAAAAQRLGGLPVDFGSTAYRFSLLPRVPMLAVHWEGDEDFPGVFQILFGASVSAYFPLDACAIAGSMLTGRLLRAAA